MPLSTGPLSDAILKGILLLKIELLGRGKTRRNQKAENLGLICHCPRMGTVGRDGPGEKKVRLQPGLFSETLSGKNTQTDRQTWGVGLEDCQHKGFST